MADTTFAEWLRHRALAAGYDIDGARGAQARLAKATGISPTQIGRTFSGQTKPEIHSQILLSRVLGIPLDEMLIRSGDAEPSDFPSSSQPRLVSVYEAAEQWGIHTTDISVLQALVAQLQSRRIYKANSTDLRTLHARVSELAAKLAWDEGHHAGDIPEVLFGLNALSEELSDRINGKHPEPDSD